MCSSAQVLAGGTPHANVTAAYGRDASDQVSNVRFLHNTGQVLWPKVFMANVLCTALLSHLEVPCQFKRTILLHA